MGWHLSLVITDALSEETLDTALHFHERTERTTSFDTATRRGFGDNLAVAKIGQWWHIANRDGAHFQEITDTLANYGGRTIGIFLNSVGCTHAFFDYTDSVLTEGWVVVEGEAQVFAGEEPVAPDLETFLLERWKQETGVVDPDSYGPFTVFRLR